MMEFNPAFNITRLSQLLLEGTQELIGSAGISDVIDRARAPVSILKSKVIINRILTPNEWGALYSALESIYGGRGAEGITLRTGQNFFQDLFRTHGSQTGMMERDFRMLPKPRRIRKGLEFFGRLQSMFMPGSSVVVTENAENWLLQLQNCTWCQVNPRYQVALVRFYIGVIQEFLSWTSGGKFYPVREKKDDALDPAGFTIMVSKTYID